MSTALDEDLLLFEFLDEEVPCEAEVETGDDHAADVYAKVECPHCHECVLWATCLMHWELFKMALKSEGSMFSCKNCKGDTDLLENATIVGPVR